MKQPQVIIVVLILSWWASSCAVQQNALYEKPTSADTIPHIGNFYGLTIWKDYINSEVWHSPDTLACIDVKNVFDDTAEGEGALYITWNKQAEGCNWIGLAFGWDAWTSKNLKEIYNEAAVQFMVKSPKGDMAGLPWAMCLEDYSGGQAWAGVFSSYIENNQVTEEWTKVQVPLTAFDINQFNADISTVKQLIIQFEADGAIYLDDIRIVPVEGGFIKEATIDFATSAPNVMRSFNQKEWLQPIELERSKVWMSTSATHLYVHAEVTDPTPFQNMQEGKEIWNGDALELAFSTNPDASKQRKGFFLTDQHIIIRTNNDPIIWDIRNDKEVDASIEIWATDNGYALGAAIPFESLKATGLKAGKTYGLEVAVDDGDSKGERLKQYRWNNPGNEGFHNSPALWGILHVSSTYSNQ